MYHTDRSLHVQEAMEGAALEAAQSDTQLSAALASASAVDAEER